MIMLLLLVFVMEKLVLVALVVDGVGLHWQWGLTCSEARSNFSETATAPGAAATDGPQHPASQFIVFPCKSICWLISQAFSSPDGIEENTSTN